ncbi:hypothetical protein BDV27DRAFT_144891 [Aspergillus caelatus]|uniref:P-loop containing nucleoside triphosphate hydrolase protein n=1 Tax=Aspergillus caelatus TaxID=61420 RepID=A0A5N7A5P6_9EURO|nr:uncharacterized protein BDV27DRAFT_144891 [Aspergillus caelatus]KAE8364923.1 hypothetical protein BDV27DRAFT_144891 [Aspergillus caelatus]
MGSIEDFTSSTPGTTSCISTLSDVALKDPIFSDEVIQYHLSLLKPGNGGEVVSDESMYSPIVSSSVLAYHAKLGKKRDNPKIPQFGLLAGSSPLLQNIHRKKASLGSLDEDPRLLFNVSHPSSIFICGSQGSGKSHTLSCLLESCLISSKVGRLPNPLTGLVFHYDTFISDTVGSPCEAAFLSSHSDVQVRVLCSPTNLHTMRQRLDTLESFMPPEQVDIKKPKKQNVAKGSIWDPVYMNLSAEAQTFTETLLSAVRLQRHLGTRVMISTQEPTVSTALLNLCSVTIVHRFTSPEWLRTLQKHLAAAASNPFSSKSGSGNTSSEMEEQGAETDSTSAFDDIVRLRVGEALLFAPSAIVKVGARDDGRVEFYRLGSDFLPIKVRERLTSDGGKSVLSV